MIEARPFSPLQAIGVTVVWTNSVTPDGEIANGSPASNSNALARSADRVKAAALKNLIAASDLQYDRQLQ